MEANEDTRLVQVNMTPAEIDVLLDAISDKWVEMSKEVRRRKATATEPYERLEDRLDLLCIARDRLKRKIGRS